MAKVVFHQHDGHYTQHRGTYDTEGDRPIVYIGKVAQDSYHAHCDERCMFTEFFIEFRVALVQSTIAKVVVATGTTLETPDWN